MTVQWCLSEKPRKLRERIKREAFLTEALIIKREAERSRERFKYTSSINSNTGNHNRKRQSSNTSTSSQL